MTTSNDTLICQAQLRTSRMEAARLGITLPKRLTAIRCDCYRSGSGWFLVENRDGFTKSVVAFNAYEAKSKAILWFLDQQTGGGQMTTVADFKERIAIMMRERETGKKYSVIGGPRAHSCVVRKSQPKGKQQ